MPGNIAALKQSKTLITAAHVHLKRPPRCPISHSRPKCTYRPGPHVWRAYLKSANESVKASIMWGWAEEIGYRVKEFEWSLHGNWIIYEVKLEPLRGKSIGLDNIGPWIELTPTELTQTWWSSFGRHRTSKPAPLWTPNVHDMRCACTFPKANGLCMSNITDYTFLWINSPVECVYWS